METPLQLLERVSGDSWDEILLTKRGRALATENNSALVLEESLNNIVFAREPFFTPTRVAEYSEFAVRPYAATLRVMERTQGWIDRDEYDLFVSRIRSTREIGWAVSGVQEFRILSPEQRQRVLEAVRARVPGAKPYQNWRDMALHTFTLFSIGQSAIRANQQLVLTSEYGGEAREIPFVQRPPAGRAYRPRPQRDLLIPNPDASAELQVPPAARMDNTGVDAEILVGKLLEAKGWRVVYYSNRRGFGFDLWASKDASAIVIEVKSSVGEVGPIVLTPLEYEAAQHHRSNYVLAIVENVETAPSFRFIQDPITSLQVNPRENVEYIITRADWVRVALEDLV